MKSGENGIIYHPAYLGHITDREHPESPDRLRAIMLHLEKSGLSETIHFHEPEAAPTAEIARIHDGEYISSVEKKCSDGGGILDFGDTVVSPDSYRAARYAAGAGITAVNMAEEGTLKRIICLVRPPGHHAEADRAMGFCLFNNAAIAARYWLDRVPGRRICIVDWDVHHGNGTQNSFYSSPEVLYISLHQYPLFPGTGFPEETGTGEGRGYTLNIQCPPGTEDEAYLDVFNAKVLPAIRTYKPEGIIISAGFDSHYADPLANLKLTEIIYKILTEKLVLIAREYADGKIISFLEGGYNLDFLPKCLENHIIAMA